MKDGSVKRFIAPQNCEACDSAPAGKHCFTKYNCTLYSGTADLNLNRVAEQTMGYQTMQDWERDVDELKRLMGVEGV